MSGQEQARSDEKDANYTACSFAIHKGGVDYCKGDVRFPHTHATLCPGFSARVIPSGVDQ